MKYDKITIIGVAVCVLLLLSWGRILTALGVPRPGPAVPASSETTPAPAEPGVPAPPALPPGSPAPEASAALGPQPAAAALDPEGDPRRQPWEAPRAAPASLAAPGVMTAGVDPGGAGVTRVTLERFVRDVVPPEAPREPVVLSSAAYPFLALNLRRSGLGFGPATTLETTPQALEISRQTASGITLTERWEVATDSPYQVRYTARFRQDGAAPVALQGLALEVGAMPPNVSTRPAASKSVASTVTVAAMAGGRPRSFSAKQLAKLMHKGKDAELESRPAKWVAVQSQYFMLAVVAGSIADDASFAGCQADLRSVVASAAPGRDFAQIWCQARGLLAPCSLEPGRDTVLTFTGLAAPKDYTFLRQLGGRLETLAGMDSFMFWNPAWMGLLTRWLLDLLIWLNGLFNVSWGYGLAIIVITLAVKVIFWPLTHHYTNSMRRMQALQPQLKELREKCKDDPQKLYRKQAELFKENKVSQFGGCLPMLLQLPVFFALFVTFRGAIELRHASFLWSADLSMPDDVFGLPIRPLAILMGATMFLQQKLTPSVGDPQQQRMMNFMSIFFIFLFYSMPSGLTLYWTVSQILSIVQMLLSNRLNRRADDQIKAALPGAATDASH